jgi:hypothetical protein
MPGGLRQRDGNDGPAASSQGSSCRNSAAADRQFPAVIVAGPRREGKQTLLRQIFSAAACHSRPRIGLDKLADLPQCRTADAFTD